MSFPKRETIVLLSAIFLTSTFLPTIAPSLAAPQPDLVSRHRVTVGMSETTVLRVMGQPTSKSGNFWVWISGDKQSAYGVTFKDGRVVRCGALQG